MPSGSLILTLRGRPGVVSTSPTEMPRPRDPVELRIQVVDEHRHCTLAGSILVGHDVHRRRLRESPRRLAIVGTHVRRLSEQPLVPVDRCIEHPSQPVPQTRTRSTSGPPFVIAGRFGRSVVVMVAHGRGARLLVVAVIAAVVAIGVLALASHEQRRRRRARGDQRNRGARRDRHSRRRRHPQAVARGRRRPPPPCPRGRQDAARPRPAARRSRAGLERARGRRRHAFASADPSGNRRPRSSTSTPGGECRARPPRYSTTCTAHVPRGGKLRESASQGAGARRRR